MRSYIFIVSVEIKGISAKDFTVVGNIETRDKHYRFYQYNSRNSLSIADCMCEECRTNFRHRLRLFYGHAGHPSD